MDLTTYHAAEALFGLSPLRNKKIGGLLVIKNSNEDQ